MPSALLIILRMKLVKKIFSPTLKQHTKNIQIPNIFSPVLHCLNKLNNSISIIVGNSNPENSLAASEYQNYLPSIEIAGMAKTKQLPHIEKCDEFIENVEIFLSDAEECE